MYNCIIYDGEKNVTSLWVIEKKKHLGNNIKSEINFVPI